MEPEIVCEENSQTDLLPENCTYADTGCELSGSCLHCPFTQCVYETPRGKQSLRTALRDRQIAGLFRGGKDTAVLAAMFGVSKRTIQRIVRKNTRLKAT